MAEAKWINYKDKEILFEDYNGEQSVETILTVIKQSEELVVNSGKKGLLVLTDVTDMHFNDDIISAMKIQSEAQKPYVAKSAVLGITAIKKVFLNTFSKILGMQIHAFKTKEEALEWLIKD